MTICFRVVGVTFSPGYPETFHRLAALPVADPERTTVVLVRDPDNEHDPNAVEVHVPAIGQKIGHAPRHAARFIARKLDEGCQITAEIESIGIDPDHPDRPGLTVRCETSQEARRPLSAEPAWHYWGEGDTSDGS